MGENGGSNMLEYRQATKISNSRYEHEMKHLQG